MLPATMRKLFQSVSDLSSTIYRERIVAFPWQQWLRKRITLLNLLLFIRRVRKVAKSVYQLRHIRPSVRMYQLGSH
jgi:hypothetical protein